MAQWSETVNGTWVEGKEEEEEGGEEGEEEEGSVN